MARIFGTLVLFILVIGVATAADINSDLIGYWPLDGDAKDASGGGNHGEAIGNPEWVDGIRGQAVMLAGEAGEDVQHIYVPDLVLVSDAVTWVAWINGWKNDTWTGIMVARGTTDGGPNDNGIGFGDNDALHYTWKGNTTWDWHDGPVIPQDTWAMVAVSLGPTEVNAYIYTEADGLQVSTRIDDNPEETIERLIFGWDECCGGARWFIGMMDEVLLYNRALSEDDILALTLGSPTAVEPASKLATTWGEIK